MASFKKKAEIKLTKRAFSLVKITWSGLKKTHWKEDTALTNIHSYTQKNLILNLRSIWLVDTFWTHPLTISMMQIKIQHNIGKKMIG